MTSRPTHSQHPADTPAGTREADRDARSDEKDARVIAHARVLPLDIVQAKGNGHAGTAVGLTPALYVLFQEYLRHDPADPHWPGRDRFVLSCGHTSLSLYLQLYLSGYGLEMDDLRAARSLDSATPGHPERGHTPGVETTTGPLGQGLANAVGMAMERRRLRGLLDPGGEQRRGPFDHRVWCLASDGDIQEGISHEASALAGHLRLDDLVVIWDDNRISIEGDTMVATSEDVEARYAAYGWQVISIDDAENLDQVRRGFDRAVLTTGAPVFIRLRSRIGHPMPSVGGTGAAHAGAVGEEEIAATKLALGLDPARHFAMPDDLLGHARRVRDRGRRAHRAWDGEMVGWRSAHPGRAELLDRLSRAEPPVGWPGALPTFDPADGPLATRQASQRVLAAMSATAPELWGGSADLAETNGTLVTGMTSFLPPGVSLPEWPGGPSGQMVHFGVREHAMGAILNGMALSGLTRPYGATFFVFADYMRPAVRLAALMRLPVLYIWSHDSVAVGEDGPTHQPVEHLWSFRGVPGLDVVRPADAHETLGAWRRWIERPGGPTALCLSRQGLPVLPDLSVAGAQRGAYVVEDSDTPTPDVVIIATGAEVHVAVEARHRLLADGVHARVVSAPCLEWFEAESAEYVEEVLPSRVRARVSVEAGIDQGWYRWIGSWGETVSVDGFGASGAGTEVLRRSGITIDAVIHAALTSIGRAHAADSQEVSV